MPYEFGVWREVNNKDRARWAEDTLAKFRELTGTDKEDAVADLLCSLMHYADQHGEDFVHQLARARDHFYDEMKMDADGLELAVNDRVNVPEPDHADDRHKHAFVGRVDGFRDNNVVVVDQEDNAFEIRGDRLTYSED